MVEIMSRDTAKRREKRMQRALVRMAGDKAAKVRELLTQPGVVIGRRLEIFVPNQKEKTKDAGKPASETRVASE